MPRAKNKHFDRNLNQHDPREKTIKYADCPGCIYWRPMNYSGHSAPKLCHYMLDTGKSRGCSSEECYANKIHYSDTKPVKKTFNRNPRNW